MHSDKKTPNKNDESPVNPTIKFNKDYSALTPGIDTGENAEEEEAVEETSPVLDEQDLEENDLDEDKAEDIEWEDPK